ncbi:mechanosensitive ion channel family protein [Saliphagus infecundisoli]|uniref:Mechanosensitive ion channel family protein n=1 Tax=Saliphagus infecundisoli TaxID=1849069 RepID=A0ABD5QBU8_9EURY|nr:mechanosensitive ion channel family protein [Saliphagus infecundisoli]
MAGVPLQTETETATGEGGNALPNWVADSAGEVLFALIVLLAGWYLSKVAVRLAGRTVAQRISRPSVTRMVLRGVRGSVLFFTVMLVVTILFDGFEAVVSVAVFSAVIGIVLAPLVGSFINGLFVLADQPYEIGDMVEIADAGHQGFVEDITIRYTKITTLDNTFMVVPNAEIRTRDVINYSAEDERTRLGISFEVTYESDVDLARTQAEQAARSVEEVIGGGPDIRVGSARYPAGPRCYIDEYAASGMRLTLRYWITSPYKLLAARSKVQERIRERYADADVEIAYPHTHHVFDETSGSPRVRLDDGGRVDGNREPPADRR